MKKRFLTASLATMMVLSLAACGGGKAADTTTAPAATEAPADTKAEDKAEETKAEETKAEAEAAGEKAPEDYKGTVVVYSPHDADPLNAGVNLFMEKYPNVKVEVVAAGTGELCRPTGEAELQLRQPIPLQMYCGAEALTPWQLSRNILSHMYVLTTNS